MILYWLLGLLTVLTAAAIFMFFALALVSAFIVLGGVVFLILLPGILAGWEAEKQAESDVLET